MNQINNDKGVCRTAPATLGVLIRPNEEKNIQIFCSTGHRSTLVFQPMLIQALVSTIFVYKRIRGYTKKL